MAGWYIRQRTNQPSAKQEQEPPNDDLNQHLSRTLPAAASAAYFANAAGQCQAVCHGCERFGCQNLKLTECSG